MAYWVIGGEYVDTKFQQIADGKEEKYGPFPTYDAAHHQWANRAWATVDECHRRYRIIAD